MNVQSSDTQVSELPGSSNSDQPAGNHVHTAVNRIKANMIDGLSAEVKDAGNVIYTTMNVVNEETITIWATQLRVLRKHWPADQIIYMMNDFPGFTAKFLNVGLAHARTIVTDTKELRSYVALVMPHNLAGQIAEFAIRAARFLGQREHMQVFYRNEDALRWLRACRAMEERKRERKSQATR